MIKYFLSFTILCSVFFSAVAQTNEDFAFKSLESEFAREKVVLSISLLGPLDINSPSLTFGLDLKVSEQFGIHQELGYINNWINPLYTVIDQDLSGRVKNKNGIKYVIEPRFYPFDKQKPFASTMFFATAFDFRYVNIGRNEFVSRFNASYNQRLKYKIDKLSFSGIFKYGFTPGFDVDLPIDVTFGLGARFTTKQNNLPADAALLPTQTFLFGSGPIEGPSIHPVFHIGLYFHIPVKKM